MTIKKPLARWGHNGIGYKTQPVFWNEIQEYGWDSFDHEIFASHLTAEEAANMESLLIRELNTRDPMYGYNVEDGGKYQTDEARKKIGDAERGEKHQYYGKHRSEETRKKISDSLKGENHYWYGKHLPEETRKKIGDAHRGKPLPKNVNHPSHSKRIMCVETEIVYPSIAEVQRQLGIHHSSIVGVLKGKRLSAGGYHWKYYD